MQENARHQIFAGAIVPNIRQPPVGGVQVQAPRRVARRAWQRALDQASERAATPTNAPNRSHRGACGIASGAEVVVLSLGDGAKPLWNTWLQYHGIPRLPRTFSAAVGSSGL